MFVFRKIVRGAGYFLTGLIIGALLWAIGTPAFAQIGDKPPVVNPPPDDHKPVARIVITSYTLQLFGVDGREKVALTPSGVELSDGATIDFSPAMRASGIGPFAGAVFVRLGGELYTLPVYRPIADDRAPR